MKNILFSLVAVLLLANAAAGPAPGDKAFLNKTSGGLAIQGYDPVAFFTDHKPVEGDPKFASRRDGAVYLFASKAHRDLFNARPQKYEPAFGGFCAYGISRNKLVEIDVNAFQIVNGRLLLQYNKGVRADFNQDQAGNLAKAEANWPGLVAKKWK